MENMTLTPDLSQAPIIQEKPKRMLGLSKKEDGRDLIHINFSSLSLINDCLRKAQLNLIEGYRSNVEAEATLFGKGIHKALEHWYCLPTNLRQLTDVESDLANTLIGQPLSQKSEPYETALDSINEFVKTCQPLKWLGDTDKRSLNNGIKILKAYFKHYAEDGLEVLRDESGQPYLERECEAVIHEDSEKVIVLFGTIDVIFRNLISGHILPGDHKTTATLGDQFYKRVKPNHQYTAYVFLCQETLGIDANEFLVNGIQVAKTKCEFARQITDRNEDDIAELKMAIVEAVERILKAKETGNYPMSAPNNCSSYGSCPYLEVCSAPIKLRNTILKSNYGVK